MQLRQLISVLVTAEMALAVDMTYYNPLPGVTVEFRAFIEAYVGSDSSSISNTIRTGSVSASAF